MSDDEETARVTAQYPPADITPAQFERFTVELFEATSPYVDGLQVTLHDKVEGTDGTDDFDATVRFALAGMDFLVLIEAKRHAHPIKRELVQVLQTKLRSVGAQKAAMISTAPYQSGAMKFAQAHGIALATITEGRFTYATRSTDPSPVTREQAADRFGTPDFVGHVYIPGEAPGSSRTILLSPEYPDYVAELLLGVKDAATASG
jgi:hypothetical protein